MVPVVLEMSGADIKRGRHVILATVEAERKGIKVVSDVFFADKVHSVLKKGLGLQKGLDLQDDDAPEICLRLHNELRKGGRIHPPPEVNEAMWRIAESFLHFQEEAIPERSKMQFLKSLGSNQPSWDRAVYGVFREDDRGKRVVSKRAVDDLSELRSLDKAGINLELMLRVLSKMGVLEPILGMVERRVTTLVRLRQRLGLGEKGNAAVDEQSAK